MSDDHDGEYRLVGDQAMLSFERGGTRIVLQMANGAGAQAVLIKTALSMEPVSGP